MRTPPDQDATGSFVKWVVRAAVKGIVVACTLFALVFVFSLGYFLIIILPLGAIIAGASTVSEQHASRRAALIFAIAAASYVVSTTALYLLPERSESRWSSR